MTQSDRIMLSFCNTYRGQVLFFCNIEMDIIFKNYR